MKNLSEIQTFTLREIAEMEGSDYGAVLARKRQGKYIRVSFLSGSLDAVKESHRYLSLRTSEVLLSLMKQGIFDASIAEDRKNGIIAEDLRKKRRPIVTSYQFEKNPDLTP